MASAAELDPARYGVIVRTSDGRMGVLLPVVAGVDTAEQQLDVARRKSGISSTEPVQIERFQTEQVEEN